MSYNSLISDKLGYCIDCADGKLKPIIAKRCKARHYMQHLKKKSWDRRVIAYAKKNEQEEWFSEIMEREQPVCWNCSAKAKWLKDEQFTGLWRSCVAHILPKREDFGFPSVAAHPMNYMILFPACSKICACHDIYDTMYESYANDESRIEKFTDLKVFPIALKRFKRFKKDIAQDELYRIPQAFLT